MSVDFKMMGIGSAVSKAFHWKEIGRICVLWAKLWLYSLGTVLSSCLNTMCSYHVCFLAIVWGALVDQKCGVSECLAKLEFGHCFHRARFASFK